MWLIDDHALLGWRLDLHQLFPGSESRLHYFAVAVGQRPAGSMYEIIAPSQRINAVVIGLKPIEN